jgi:methanol metabolism-related c-type cytochrome
MGYKSLHRRTVALAILLPLSLAAGAQAVEESAGDIRAFSFSTETPYFYQDGKVDFGTYNGFRRYHSECHVCHGPAGMGSSYAPALTDSLKTLTFQDFVHVIVQGRQGQENFVMPSFAENMNVLPYLHDLYAYLKARSDGAIPGAARPDKFPKNK